MLQLVLVSCVSGTSRKNMSPTKKQRRAKFFATDQHEIHHHCWYNCDVYLKQLYSAYYAWDILETKKQHRWNSDWNSYIFHAHPWILARKKRQARRQLVIMTSLDLSSASWHPCQIMARVDNIKYMKHFEVSSLCFAFFKIQWWRFSSFCHIVGIHGNAAPSFFSMKLALPHRWAQMFAKLRCAKMLSLWSVPPWPAWIQLGIWRFLSSSLAMPRGR